MIIYPNCSDFNKILHSSAPGNVCAKYLLYLTKLNLFAPDDKALNQRQSIVRMQM